MTRDAHDHAVVELCPTTVGVSADVVGVEWLAGKISAASLTFAVSGDEKLPDLARRKITAAVRGVHGDLSGLHRFRTLLA